MLSYLSFLLSVCPVLTHTPKAPCRAAVPLLLLFLAFMPALPVWAQDTKTVGEIEYYGYRGIRSTDLARLKARLPLRVGDAVTRDGGEKIKADIRQSVQEALGRPATDVEIVCCDPQGRLILYVGLLGTNARTGDYLPVPMGKVPLPAQAYRLYQQDRAAVEAAVRRGSAAEDDARGYAVMHDPAAQKMEKALRAYALQHTPEIIRTLRGAADAEQRAAAAILLGYAEASPGQIAELVCASRDPADDVRDEATRALGVLASSKLAVGRQIPAEPFLAMLNSSVWTDRNKAAFVLGALSSHRTPKLLHDLKANDLASLIEMARWDLGHATTACLILARIAGMPDQQAFKLMLAGKAEAIISAVTAK